MSDREGLLQEVNGFVKFINEMNLSENGNTDFKTKLDEFIANIARYQDSDSDSSLEEEDTSSPDAGTSSGSVEPGGRQRTARGTQRPDLDAPLTAANSGNKSSDKAWHVWESTAAAAAKIWEEGSADVQIVTRPHAENASFPRYIPDPSSPGAWQRRDGQALTAAEFSAQALAILSTDSQLTPDESFATRLEQAVSQREAPLDVFRAADRIEYTNSPLSPATRSKRNHMSAYDGYPASPGMSAQLDPQDQRLHAGYGMYEDSRQKDASWVLGRVRDRELWGHSRDQEGQHLYMDGGGVQDISSGGQETRPMVGSPDGLQGTVEWERAAGNRAQLPSPPHDELLNARHVELYLGQRGVHIPMDCNAVRVEVDPYDFNGFSDVFANGRRGAGRDPRRMSGPAPYESTHPDPARAAATVHTDSITPLFTDTTATGAADTGSYNASLCPAIPIRSWLKHRPGKAELTIDVNRFLKGATPPISQSFGRCDLFLVTKCLTTLLTHASQTWPTVLSYWSRDQNEW